MSQYLPKYVELLNTINSSRLKNWDFKCNAKKIFDKKSRTYAYHLNEKRPVHIISLAQKINKNPCCNIHYQFLIIQLCLISEEHIFIDVGVTTYPRENPTLFRRKRISFSTTKKTHVITPISTSVPFSLKNRENWVHLILDVEEVVANTWPDEDFQSINSVHLGGMCLLKHIFAVRTDLLHVHAGIWHIDFSELPKHLSLPIHIPIVCQYVTFNKDSISSNSNAASVSDVRDKNPHMCYHHCIKCGGPISNSGHENMTNLLMQNASHVDFASGVQNLLKLPIQNVFRNELNQEKTPNDELNTIEHKLLYPCTSITSAIIRAGLKR